MRRSFLNYGVVVCGLFLLALFHLRCSQTKGGGGGVTEPDAQKPYIIESLLCSDISDDDMPVGIADTYPAGSRIYLWVHWANLVGEHYVEVSWYDPDGDEIHHDIIEFDSPNSRQITWFFLNTTTSAQTGEWLVALFLDGEFMRSLVFEII